MINFGAVILAGGEGVRFWPLSTSRRPKQFLKIFGGESLIRQSVRRLEGVVKRDSLFVLTNKSLVSTTRKELYEIPSTNIIGEPECKDTGAAVALGVSLLNWNEDTVIGFFPSDHLVANERKFRAVVKKAISLARRRKAIVTIGIKPTYPSSDFGYIDVQRGCFIEKPDALYVKKFLKSGCLWNAGMFIARASVFKEAFKSYATELYPLASGKVSPFSLSSFYKSLGRKSFDFAVMEKLSADRRKSTISLEVILGDFGWEDVDSFKVFDKYFPLDLRGNAIEGTCTMVDAESNICIARDTRISLLGVKNLVVVSTMDALLVVDKARISEIKKLADMVGCNSKRRKRTK